MYISRCWYRHSFIILVTKSENVYLYEGYNTRTSFVALGEICNAIQALRLVLEVVFFAGDWLHMLTRDGVRLYLFHNWWYVTWRVVSTLFALTHSYSNQTSVCHFRNQTCMYLALCLWYKRNQCSLRKRTLSYLSDTWGHLNMKWRTFTWVAYIILPMRVYFLLMMQKRLKNLYVSYHEINIVCFICNFFGTKSCTFILAFEMEADLLITNVLHFFSTWSLWTMFNRSYHCAQLRCQIREQKYQKSHVIPSLSYTASEFGYYR